jgi:hypothetical protein
VTRATLIRARSRDRIAPGRVHLAWAWKAACTLAPPVSDGFLTRLRRTEGKVRGLQKAAEDDKYRIGILTR